MAKVNHVWHCKWSRGLSVATIHGLGSSIGRKLAADDLVDHRRHDRTPNKGVKSELGDIFM